jgi:hypothetical protein
MSAFSFFGRAFLPFGWALGDGNTFPKESNKTNSKICIYKWTSTMVCFCVLLQLLWMNRLTLWIKTSFARLEWPSTHQCTIQTIPFWDFMDGMKLSPRGQFLWSVLFFFLLCFFLGFFFFFFFFQLTFFFLLALPGDFFLPTTSDPKFFFGTPTSPPSLPIRPSCYRTYQVFGIRN